MCLCSVIARKSSTYYSCNDIEALFSVNYLLHYLPFNLFVHTVFAATERAVRLLLALAGSRAVLVQI